MTTQLELDEETVAAANARIDKIIHTPSQPAAAAKKTRSDKGVPRVKHLNVAQRDGVLDGSQRTRIMCLSEDVAQWMLAKQEASSKYAKAVAALEAYLDSLTRKA